ncbi:hypothetical protein IE4872_CH02274 [Rhizobium gallicum]|uniref:Uncharacterized protein n=1 Tax=Rhizobium gallicum TaxID=56730 RepID=A0A1L5NJ49_9HYPH|nr:hypothetical protein IE4872_CH02274 [Rhizobium gallicum]
MHNKRRRYRVWWPRPCSSHGFQRQILSLQWRVGIVATPSPPRCRESPSIRHAFGHDRAVPDVCAGERGDLWLGTRPGRLIRSPPAELEPALDRPCFFVFFKQRRKRVAAAARFCDLRAELDLQQ